jgi:hypothetical protein
VAAVIAFAGLAHVAGPMIAVIVVAAIAGVLLLARPGHAEVTPRMARAQDALNAPLVAMAHVAERSGVQARLAWPVTRSRDHPAAPGWPWPHAGCVADDNRPLASSRSDAPRVGGQAPSPVAPDIKAAGLSRAPATRPLAGRAEPGEWPLVTLAAAAPAGTQHGPAAGRAAASGA